MKHLRLSSAAALAAAVSLTGCVTPPLDAQDAAEFKAPGENVTWWRAPDHRDVAHYDGPWYYDATTGYYYSRPYYDHPERYYDAPSRYYRAPRAYYDESRAYPSVSSGVVERIELVRRGDGGEVAGTIIGGIVGGVIGNQIGSGSGNTAATIAGAAGGAVVGHELGRRARDDEAFRVTVRLDNGAFHTVMLDRVSDLRMGDRVRIEGNTIYRG
jgi:outer membrane lipoprotein SlyB